MQKVVISENGDFGLSHEGIMYYGKLSGASLYPYVEIQEGGIFKFDVTPLTKENRPHYDSYIMYFYKEIDENTNPNNTPLFNEYFIKRHDPFLIQTVLDLKEQSGRNCKLKVVEIPDDVKYYIEYSEQEDCETIHEEHRTWK